MAVCNGTPFTIERSPPQARLEEETARSAGQRFTHQRLLFQDDVRMVMKGCVQWNVVYGWTDFRRKRTETRDS